VTGPVRLRQPDERERQLLCAHQDRCIDVAVSGKWRGFSCTGCTAYKKMSDEQRRREVAGFLRACACALDPDRMPDW
jgi:hypothetical protein